jgi:hypothetical protein
VAPRRFSTTAHAPPSARTATEEAPIMISHDDTRDDPGERRVLYVLGFGIAGAIAANSAIFGYFALLYASC